MLFEVTADNKPYLDARGKIVLNACPGSGKTSAISYKLIQLTQDCESLFGQYSGIACLSFTNVAKEEIGNKYQALSNTRLGYPHLISTIDSFINQYITLPFYYLLNKKSQRPSILDTVYFLDEMNLGTFANKKRQPLKFSYPPSKLKIEIDGTYSWKGNIPDALIVDPIIFNNYARAFKKWQFDNGYLNNDDSIYIACHLLETYPHIAESLVHRFPYVIIDEAQDTSEIQYKIFDLLIKAGLKNIEFVGDPYQSLYEFREARPDLFIKRHKDTANWQSLNFSNCRRSTQNIINAYSLFRGNGSTSITSSSTHTSDFKVKVIRYDENNPADLITKYEALIDPLKTNYVLVRGQTHLEKFGVKLSSENPWKNEIAMTLIDASILFDKGNTKGSIDTLRTLFVKLQHASADHKTMKENVEIAKSDILGNIRLFDFVKNMPSINDTVEHWTSAIPPYILTVFGITVDMELKQRKGPAYYLQNIKDLFCPPISHKNPVSTIHKVKGMTFNSTLLVLSANSTGANISLNDFITPADMPSEKQRLIYVALSRAEVLSCIAVPDSISEADIVAKLGNQYEF